MTLGIRYYVCLARGCHVRDARASGESWEKRRENEICGPAFILYDYDNHYQLMIFHSLL